jgi:hypothetical protein
VSSSLDAQFPVELAQFEKLILGKIQDRLEMDEQG